MGRRRKYFSALTECEIAAFVSEATAMHQTVINRKIPLSFGCEHHQALEKLHEAITTAIREVSGQEPPWMEPHANHLLHHGRRGSA